jgi:formate dehydrogenase iron-sulfur subunit
MPAEITEVAIRVPEAQRMGFFTDTTVCIGCKACEVACKQWNDLPADGSPNKGKKGISLDYTGRLSAATWRHVRFVETVKPTAEQEQAAREMLARGEGGRLPSLPAGEDLPAGAGPVAGAASEELPSLIEMAEGADAVGTSARLGGWDQAPTGAASNPGATDGGLMDRWVFQSDVCKHCTNAGCLDACPTGALIRTEFETVIVQSDICNGCGYCVASCPFGVIDRDPYDGRAAKCTLCYDRLQDGLEPACAKACPTDSIQFGPYDELVETAKQRVLALHERGLTGAYLYGAGDEPGEELAGGLGAFFLLTEPPERFGLPAQAESPAQENGPTATAAGLAAGTLAATAAVLRLVVGHRRAQASRPTGLRRVLAYGRGS